MWEPPAIIEAATFQGEVFLFRIDCEKFFLLQELTFGKLPQFFGCKDAGRGDHVVADDSVVRVVRETCRDDHYHGGEEEDDRRVVWFGWKGKSNRVWVGSHRLGGSLGLLVIRAWVWGSPRGLVGFHAEMLSQMASHRWWHCQCHQGWQTTKYCQWMKRQMAVTPMTSRDPAQFAIFFLIDRMYLSLQRLLFDKFNCLQPICWLGLFCILYSTGKEGPAEGWRTLFPLARVYNRAQGSFFVSINILTDLHAALFYHHHHHHQVKKLEWKFIDIVNFCGHTKYKHITYEIQIQAMHGEVCSYQ